MMAYLTRPKDKFKKVKKEITVPGPLEQLTEKTEKEILITKIGKKHYIKMIIKIKRWSKFEQSTLLQRIIEKNTSLLM